MRWTWMAWAAVTTMLGEATATTAAENRGYKRVTAGTMEGLLWEGALLGAKERLARPACQQVFSDFTDASGRTLRENLDALGQTAESYLDLVIFYDAAGSGRCGNPSTLAMTEPGSRVVFVCVPQFAAERRARSRLTEIILIHEALHTLGLGENPPSSSAITRQVTTRCH